MRSTRFKIRSSRLKSIVLDLTQKYQIKVKSTRFNSEVLNLKLIVLDLKSKVLDLTI